MQKKSHQHEGKDKGYTLLVLIFVILFAITLFGVFKMSKKRHDEMPHSTTRVQVPATGAVKQDPQQERWVTYRNDATRVTFSYPADWKQNTSPEEYLDDHILSNVKGTLTAPSGNMFKWIYSPAGGKGGGCVPDSSDIAFSTDNKCDSKEIFNIETFDSSGPPNELFRADSKFVLTETKYQAVNSSKITYQLCLDRELDDSLGYIKKGTRMGLIFPCEFWSTGFNAIFEVTSQNDFHSPEAETAKSIMHSFNSY